MLDFFATLGTNLAAVVVSVLPRRYWTVISWLPVERAALASVIVTVIASAVIGLGGFLSYSARILKQTGQMTLKVAEAQLQGKLPDDPSLNVSPLGMAMLSPLAYALFTPVGLFATYLAVSGLLRGVSIAASEPMGDPMLTLIDSALHRVTSRTRAASAKRSRERAEGVAVPDRLYPASWANLTDAEFVVVSSRRKPDWDAGTVVITPDRWFVVGEPFERTLPDGLRTIYPLKEHTSLEVMRRSVEYRLPPLRRDR